MARNVVFCDARMWENFFGKHQCKQIRAYKANNQSFNDWNKSKYNNFDSSNTNSNNGKYNHEVLKRDPFFFLRRPGGFKSKSDWGFCNDNLPEQADPLIVFIISSSLSNASTWTTGPAPAISCKVASSTPGPMPTATMLTFFSCKKRISDTWVTFDWRRIKLVLRVHYC